VPDEGGSAPPPHASLYLGVSAKMHAMAAAATCPETRQDFRHLAALYERLAARTAWRAQNSPSPPPVWRGACFNFEREAIAASAPSAPGVYVLWSGNCWIYVGESNNIQWRLIAHVDDESEWTTREAPRSFGFEVIPDPGQRVSYRNALIQVLAPTWRQLPR
jgi:hypothetical protein